MQTLNLLSVEWVASELEI